MVELTRKAPAIPTVQKTVPVQNVHRVSPQVRTVTTTRGSYAGVRADARRSVNDAKSLASEVFADNVVTFDEYQKLELNADEVIRDFLISYEVLQELERSGNVEKRVLDNARYVMNQLKEARDLAFVSLHRASFANNVTNEEAQKREQRREEGEVLFLSLRPEEIILLESIRRERALIAYEKSVLALTRPIGEQERFERLARIEQMRMVESQEHSTPIQFLQSLKQRQNA